MKASIGRVATAAQALGEAGFGGGYACAIALGTGLGAVVEALEIERMIAYANVPHFPASGVSGHKGRLVAGRLAGRRVLILEGRSHYYETGDAAAMHVPLGAIAALGAPVLMLTNAAGSTRPETRPGALVAIADHIAFSGLNPLIGETDDRRFVPMTNAYDPALRALLRDAAGAIGEPIEEGVYMWFSGPSFETPAEIRMARALGADLVGMSTVPEAILARFFGLRVAGVSVVTNMAAGIGDGSPSHAETKAVAGETGGRLARLLDAFVARLPETETAP
ncbi:MAG: purine-nucleoside phosphorylase [Salinarimonadaceae bacterium]|nr:MAG: purine-nucleoside phosphorylase [Salinarimonadaceae bacterium]